jgi:hypothetical protein
MKPIKIPPEYKDKFHLKDEDLERINIHIVKYEEELKRKKKSRIWVWVLAGILLVSVILFELVDISSIKKLLGITKFSIKERVVIEGNIIDIRFSKPLKGKVQVIIEPIEIVGGTMIMFLSKNETNEVFIKDRNVYVVMLGDEKEITISTKSGIKRVNLEELEEFR